MVRAVFIAILAALLPVTAALAQDGQTHARMFINDALGDGHDRDRTGSYFFAGVWGYDVANPPTTPFELWEWRIRTEIVAPADLVAPEAWDRRYAGILAPGVFTHFTRGGYEAMVGLEIAMTGPQTGVGRFQRTFHEWIGLPEPLVLETQIPDGVHPTLRVEVGRPFHFSNGASRGYIRPFVEGQAGLESYARVGFDLLMGGWGQSTLMLRDTVTGLRTEGAPGTDGPGVSFTMGADVARMFESDLLPEGGVAVMTDTRARARLGFNWKGEASQVFYGLAWLGKEFEAQPRGQVVGAMHFHFRF